MYCPDCGNQDDGAFLEFTEEEVQDQLSLGISPFDSLDDGLSKVG